MTQPVRRVLMVALVASLVAAGCAAPSTGQASTQPATAHQPVPSVTPLPAAPAASATAASSMAAPACQLAPIVVPTAAPDPGYTQLDPTTGLHMTGTVAEIDVQTYRLLVSGRVDHPLSLSYDDIRCLPKVTAKVLLTCPGYFQDTATWSGVRIKDVLALAGVQPEAERIVQIAGGGYVSRVALNVALADESFLAYEWEGQPLPILHGFPLRSIFPSQPGSFWVKWLTEIQVE
jgi:DMSO/TMAO reductase YedYZ molybdopterin-dependent catalytic subunit